MLKRLLKRPGVQAALAALLAAWFRFVHRTTRWQVEVDPATERLWVEGRPMIMALWHERLPPLICHWPHFPAASPAPRLPLHFMISGHSDGRLIAVIAARLGIASVEGSTSRGGARALARMLTLLESGRVCVAITPDGPRGPRRIAQPGVAALARFSGCPVVCTAAATRFNYRPGSWDRLMVSLPFGRGALVVGPPMAIARKADMQTALAAIKAALDEACACADTMVGLAPG